MKTDRNQRLSDHLLNVDEELLANAYEIDDAEKLKAYKKTKSAPVTRLLRRRVWMPVAAAAACVALAVGLWQGGVFAPAQLPVEPNTEGSTTEATEPTDTDVVTEPTDNPTKEPDADTTDGTADTTTDNQQPDQTETTETTETKKPTATDKTDPTKTEKPATSVTDGTDKTDPTKNTTGKTKPTTKPTTGKTKPTTKPTTVKPPVSTSTTVKPNNPDVTDPITKPTTDKTDPSITPTVYDPSHSEPDEPLPPWPYLWIIYDSKQNYDMNEIPICFKLEGFEEVDLNWVKKTSYKTNGFSIVGDINVERDAETGGLIYRMVLAYDGVTPKPSFFFSVVTADGMEQTDGLYGYLAEHGFFVGSSYDSAVSSSYYYLVEIGVLTRDEYQAIMQKIWSGYGFEQS